MRICSQTQIENIYKIFIQGLSRVHKQHSNRARVHLYSSAHYYFSPDQVGILIFSLKTYEVINIVYLLNMFLKAWKHAMINILTIFIPTYRNGDRLKVYSSTNHNLTFSGNVRLIARTHTCSQKYWWGTIVT